MRHGNTPTDSAASFTDLYSVSFPCRSVEMTGTNDLAGIFLPPSLPQMPADKGRGLDDRYSYLLQAMQIDE